MTKKKASDIADSPNAPITAMEPGAVTQWFEKWGRPVMERNRWFIASMILTMAVIALSLALVTLMPLKTIQPYVITVHDNGAVAPHPAAASHYQPGDKEKKYFLSRWIVHGWTLDPRLTQDYLEKAYAITRGKAVSQFREFVEAAQHVTRLSMNKGLTATVKILSINFLAEDTALVRYEITERDAINPEAPRKNRYVMTIHFVIDPPQTEEEILKNPIGLFITDFSFTREM